METYLERIAAAVEARKNPDFVIIARTGARSATTFGDENAGEEAFKGVKSLKTGAGIALVKSPRVHGECERLVKALYPHPVIGDILPNVLTGNHTAEDCSVRIWALNLPSFPVV